MPVEPKRTPETMLPKGEWISPKDFCEQNIIYSKQILEIIFEQILNDLRATAEST